MTLSLKPIRFHQSLSDGGVLALWCFHSSPVCSPSASLLMCKLWRGHRHMLKCGRNTYGLRALAPGCPCPAWTVQPGPIQSLAWLPLPWLDHNLLWLPWLPTLRLPVCLAARDNLGRQTRGNSNFAPIARSLIPSLSVCVSLPVSRLDEVFVGRTAPLV